MENSNPSKPPSKFNFLEEPKNSKDQLNFFFLRRGRKINVGYNYHGLVKPKTLKNKTELRKDFGRKLSEKLHHPADKEMEKPMISCVFCFCFFLSARERNKKEDFRFCDYFRFCANIVIDTSLKQLSQHLITSFFTKTTL